MYTVYLNILLIEQSREGGVMSF